MVVTLHRRQNNTACGGCGTINRMWYDQRMRHVRDLPCGDLHVRLEIAVRRVAGRTCGGVKQGRLDWLGEHPHYRRQIAFYVGKQCRGASITEVAEDLRLDRHTVKAMDTLSMHAQLNVAGPPAPAVIAIDQISIRKAHVSRIIVSDLEAGRPI